MRAGEARHHVNVMLPPQGQDADGNPQGTPEVVIKNWPCSINQLTGREGELIRQNFNAATHEVRGYIDPQRPITGQHYLQFGSRVLNVIDPEDVGERGIEYRLICGERKL